MFAQNYFNLPISINLSYSQDSAKHTIFSSSALVSLFIIYIYEWRWTNAYWAFYHFSIPLVSSASVISLGWSTSSYSIPPLPSFSHSLPVHTAGPSILPVGQIGLPSLPPCNGTIEPTVPSPFPSVAALTVLSSLIWWLSNLILSKIISLGVIKRLIYIFQISCQVNQTNKLNQG